MSGVNNIINPINIWNALGTMKNFGATLDRLKYLSYLSYAPSVIKGLFYPVEALTLLAHQFSAPYAEEYAKGLYEKQTSTRLNPYKADYQSAFKVILMLTNKFYPQGMTHLNMLKKNLIDSRILEELAKETDQPLSNWIKELQRSEETLESYVNNHLFAKKITDRFSESYLSIKDQQINTFISLFQYQLNLVPTPFLSMSPVKIAKGITSWKWELEDPDDFKWLCTKVALNTLLVIPIAYAIKESWNIMTGYEISVSYSSLMKEACFYSFLTVTIKTIAARTLKNLDSRRKSE